MPPPLREDWPPTPAPVWWDKSCTSTVHKRIELLLFTSMNSVTCPSFVPPFFIFLRENNMPTPAQCRKGSVGVKREWNQTEAFNTLWGLHLPLPDLARFHRGCENAALKSRSGVWIRRHSSLTDTWVRNTEQLLWSAKHQIASKCCSKWQQTPSTSPLTPNLPWNRDPIGGGLGLEIFSDFLEFSRGWLAEPTCSAPDFCHPAVFRPFLLHKLHFQSRAIEEKLQEADGR